MAEGSKFDGDVCTDLQEPPAPPSLSEEEEGEGGKQGVPLTASEVQALGDMALQSAVRELSVTLCCELLCNDCTV